MAVPFGFSAGDFVAGLHLLNKAVSALRDAHGADLQFQSTIIELESLGTVLRKAQSFQVTTTTSDTVEKIRFLAHHCHFPLQTFLTKLQKLEPEMGIQATLGTINADKNTRSLVTRYGKRPARKIEWALQLKEDMSELRTAIGPQLGAIEILLLLVNCEHLALLHGDHSEFFRRIQELKELIDRQNNDLSTHLTKFTVNTSNSITNQMSDQLNTRLGLLQEALNSRLASLQVNNFTYHERTYTELVGLREVVLRQDEVLQDIRQNQQVIPVVKRNPITMDTTIGEIMNILQDGVRVLFLRFFIILSYMRSVMHFASFISRSPTMLLSSNIRFEDALGRVASLQYEEFRHLPIFMARLSLKFQQTPGYDRVRLDQFSFKDVRTGRWLRTAQDWEATIKPRASIIMSMVFQRVRFQEVWYSEQPCPRCRARRDSKRRHEGMWKCTNCGFTYLIEEEIVPPWWKTEQPTDLSATHLSAITLARRYLTSSSAAVLPDSIKLYKHVNIAKTCTNPDCFSQHPRRWAKDADGHDVCEACPTDPTRGEETEQFDFKNNFQEYNRSTREQEYNRSIKEEKYFWTARPLRLTEEDPTPDFDWNLPDSY